MSVPIWFGVGIRLWLRDNLKQALFDQHMRQPALNFVGNRAGIRRGIREGERGDIDDPFQRGSGIGRAGASIFEGRNITALAQNNVNLIVSSFQSIVVFQLAPQAAGFHANDRIHAGIEDLTPVEYLDTDEVLLQPVWLAKEAFLDDEL